MRVQVFISGLLLDPGCDVGADFLIITTLGDWPVTNKVMVYFFILLGGAAGVDMEYFIRIVVALMFENCFVQLCTDFMVNRSFTFS